MKKAVAVLLVVWVLISAAQASVTFTPPGSSKPMVGGTFTMTPSGEAKKLGSTASAKVAVSKDKNTWMVDVSVSRGHKTCSYVICLAGKELGKAQKTDANGSVKLSYMGPTSPMGYKTIDVYYVPNDRKARVLMFSLETSKLKSKGK